MSNLLWALLGKSPPEPPKLKPVTPPSVQPVPVRIEPEPKAPPPQPPASLATARTLDDLNRVFDAAEKSVRNSPEEWQRLNQEYLLNFDRLLSRQQ